VAHYLFNFVQGDAAEAAELMRLRMWGVGADERHRDSLAAGDLVLVYLGAPELEFIGRAELGSAARDWTASEAETYPGDLSGGVLLAQVEEWYPPVPMSAVLERIGPSETAKAEFDTGVVRITAGEYEQAVTMAAERAS